MKPETGFIHGGHRDRTGGQAASDWWVAILISKGTYKARLGQQQDKKILHLSATL